VLVESQGVVGHFACESARARVWAVALAINGAQDECACAGSLRGCQVHARELPREPLAGITGTEEVRIALEECKRLFGRDLLAAD
jgi:hypothetical protein